MSSPAGGCQPDSVHRNPGAVPVVDVELDDDAAAVRATRLLVDRLLAGGTRVITAADPNEAAHIIGSTASLNCVLIDRDVRVGGPMHVQSDVTGTAGRTDAYGVRPRDALLVAHEDVWRAPHDVR